METCDELKWIDCDLPQCELEKKRFKQWNWRQTTMINNSAQSWYGTFDSNWWNDSVIS